MKKTGKMRKKILYADGFKNKDTAGYIVCDKQMNIVSNRIAETPITSNEAEYWAVIAAMEQVEKHGIVYTDSKLTYGHLVLKWKIRNPSLMQYVKIGKNLLKQKRILLEWIPREKNLAGICVERIYLSS